MKTIDATDRLPPNNPQAERQILGCMLRDNNAIPEIVGMIRDADFYVNANALIFQGMAELADKGKAVDIVSVAEWLTRKNLMDDVQYVYLAELWDGAPSSGHYRQMTDVVRDYSQRRRLIRASADIGRDAWDLGTDTPEIMGNAEKRILEIADMGSTGESVELRVAMTETLERMDARRGNGDGELSGVPTGFIDLDNLLCGFQKSELVIIGARPSVGKTAFALAIARHAAVDCGLPLLFVSLEQARVELAERLLCAQGRVDSHKLRRGHLNADEHESLLNAHDQLCSTKMHIDDSPMQNMLRISANARRLKQRHDIRMIVVDYLQLVMADNPRANRQEQVADTSRRLKGLARELKIPVVALCQVNRGLEDRTDKRPRLSDLRESGAIEADADTVMLLHRPDASDKFSPSNLTEVIVAKQRNGPIGDVSLLFDKRFMRFENCAFETPAVAGRIS